ncbi:MAG: hypothetical protein ACO2O4_05300 [Minisyncoccia bacterium]|jgi:ElaB/YqjD/DUF883 family membrane-anchored ribosome-binding protein
MIILKEYKDIVLNLKKGEIEKRHIIDLEEKLNNFIKNLDYILRDIKNNVNIWESYHNDLNTNYEELNEIIRDLPQNVDKYELNKIVNKIREELLVNVDTMADSKSYFDKITQRTKEAVGDIEKILDELSQYVKDNEKIPYIFGALDERLSFIRGRMNEIEKYIENWSKKKSQPTHEYVKKYYELANELEKLAPENINPFINRVRNIQYYTKIQIEKAREHYKNLEDLFKHINDLKEEISEIKKNIDDYKKDLKERIEKEVKEELEEERRKHARYRKGMGYIINAVTGTGSGMVFSYFNIPKIYGIPAGTILSTLTGKFFEGEWALSKKEKDKEEKKKEDTILSLAKNIGPHLLIGGVSTLTGYLIMDYLKKNKFGRK